MNDTFLRAAICAIHMSTFNISASKIPSVLKYKINVEKEDNTKTICIRSCPVFIENKSSSHISGVGNNPIIYPEQVVTESIMLNTRGFASLEVG